MEASAKSSGNGDSEKQTFKKRLKAWWRGYEFFDDSAPPIEVGPLEEEEPPDLLNWGARRRLALATLFGPDMDRCMPEAARIRMTRPMGLNNKMSIAEIGSGLGGFSRWIVDEYEAYVTGYEANQEMAEASNEKVKMAGVARFIKISHCDYDDFQPKERSVDAAFAAEALYCVEDKELMFRRIRSMMRPEGQFMMSDYMTDGVAPDNPDLVKWIESEPIRPHILDVAKTREYLTKAGFEVSIAEDTTKEYKMSVLKAFSDYADSNAGADPDDVLHAWVLKEGELWTSRIQAMEKGVLKVYRLYARIPSEIT